MPTISQLQSSLHFSRKQTSFAWAKFYEECNSQHNAHVSEHNLLEDVNDNNSSLPQFLIDEIQEKMKRLKEEIECPICLDIIPEGQLDITRCGHKYCKQCCQQLKDTTKKCAVCRRKIT
eukprot:COSAG02_NODE_14556_length_1260_cov_0.857881_2_plen_119_part_00